METCWKSIRSRASCLLDLQLQRMRSACCRRSWWRGVMHFVRKDIPQLLELLLCIPWAFSQSSKLLYSSSHPL